jgi:type I restriction enzyme M protein
MRAVERDTELMIDNQLRNLGWTCDPKASARNVYQQRPKTQAQHRRLGGKRPDYILYRSGSTEPIGVIEAKRQGWNIHQALEQGAQYADILDAPLVFATDGVFTKTLHLKARRPLLLNGEEVDELIREPLAWIPTPAVSPDRC